MSLALKLALLTTVAAVAAVPGVPMALPEAPMNHIDVRTYRGEDPLRSSDFGDVATLIERLPAWGDRDFNREEWGRYLAVAAALQRLKQEDVERCLLVYLDRVSRQQRDPLAIAGAISKPVIVLRVMFDTPAEPLGEDARGALQARGVSIMGNGMWYQPFDPAADRTVVSVSHPVVFDEQGPRLLGVMQVLGVFQTGSSARFSYDDHLEYRAFKELYRPRDLARFVDAISTWRELFRRLPPAGGPDRLPRGVFRTGG